MWESGKSKRKHHQQASQEFNPFPAGDHNAVKNRQDSITDQHETQITKKGSTNKEPHWNGQ